MLPCEGHLKEEGTKIVNKKEQGKESGEDTSNIGNNIEIFQEASGVGSCQGGSLNIQKCFGNSIILNVNGLLKRIAFDSFFSFQILERQKALVSDENILIKFACVQFHIFVVDLHVVGADVVLKRMVPITRIHNLVELIQIDSSAVVVRAVGIASHIDLKTLVGVADCKGSAYFKCFVEWQAPPV